MRWIHLTEGDFIESTVGRITVVLLFAIVAAITLALLFLINRVIWPVVLKFTLITATGVFTGIVSRRVLTENTRALQFLVAVLGVLLALGLVSPVTHGFIGINMLRLYPGFPAWDGMLQTGVGFTAIWLGLQVKRRVRTGSARSEARPNSAPRWRPRRAPQPDLQPRRPASTNGRPRKTGRRPRINPRPAIPLLKATKGWIAGFLSQRKSRAPRQRSLSARPRGAIVQLNGRIEHRCPFCLELVDKRDPRGVRICPECKTHHHADCWEVTGMCQVPHEHR